MKFLSRERRVDYQDRTGCPHEPYPSQCCTRPNPPYHDCWLYDYDYDAHDDFDSNCNLATIVDVLQGLYFCCDGSTETSNYPNWDASLPFVGLGWTTVSNTERYSGDGGNPEVASIYLRQFLSNEYTTAMLISNTIGALPPYPGTFTGSCSAYRNLSSDETSYSIQRFEYKFTFDAATESFVIHWIERFTPADNGSPSDTSRCEQVPVDATETSVHEVLEPTSNGTITIEDVYVEGAKPEVQQASIQDGEFVIVVPALDCSTADRHTRSYLEAPGQQ